MYVLTFLVVCLLPFAIAWNLAREVAALVFANDSFSQILVIPLVSLFFIFEARKNVFAEVSFGWVLGAAFIIPGAILLVAARVNVWHLRSTNQGALFVLGIVLIWLGAFGLFLGTHAFRTARFSLLFLFFCVPVPGPMLSNIIRLLQKQSADAAAGFLARRRSVSPPGPHFCTSWRRHSSGRRMQRDSFESCTDDYDRARKLSIPAEPMEKAPLMCGGSSACDSEKWTVHRDTLYSRNLC